jgi:hypothetical protein
LPLIADGDGIATSYPRSMRTLILASLGISAIASAEPHIATTYVQGDLMVGIAAPVAGFNAMLGAEGGLHWIGPLWGHAELSVGPAADDQGTGYNSQIRAGLEARTCTGLGLVCVVAGLDLGGQHGAWGMSGDPAAMSSTETFTGLVAIPRVLVEVGGRTLRFKLGIEADELIVGTGYHSHIGIGRGIGIVGNELVSGVAYQW